MLKAQRLCTSAESKFTVAMKFKDAYSLAMKLEVMTSLDRIFKSRGITLLTKGHTVKDMVYPVVMFGCESWTIKKSEYWRTDAFKLWCWRRLESPLDCKEIQPVHPKGNQSWIFIGRTDAETEAPILWPPDAKSNSLEKTLLLEKIEGKKRRVQQRMRRLYSITDSVNMNLSKLQEIAEYRGAWLTAVHGVAKRQSWLSNWTTTNNHL